MRNLLRKPLPWMIVSECAIVAALAMVAWHMVASPPSTRVPGVQVAAPTTQAAEPVISGPKSVAGTLDQVKPLLPGLNLDSDFWKLRLAELNRGENSFEQLEWRLVHSALDAARRYVETIVLPALAWAERPGR
jgi:hypothetical protein